MTTILTMTMITIPIMSTIITITMMTMMTVSTFHNEENDQNDNKDNVDNNTIRDDDIFNLELIISTSNVLLNLMVNDLSLNKSYPCSV